MDHIQARPRPLQQRNEAQKSSWKGYLLQEDLGCAHEDYGETGDATK
jgi:hypothetical protein